MVTPLKKITFLNLGFHILLWNNRPPRIKLEQLRQPKDRGGVVLPNPWLYYLAAQLEPGQP